jgi:hypothetical protein
MPLQNQARLVGLAGAPAAPIEAARDTAMNPDVLDAFALAVTSCGGPPAFRRPTLS